MLSTKLKYNKTYYDDTTLLSYTFYYTTVYDGANLYIAVFIYIDYF